MKGSKIGKNCTIGQNCFIGENVVIGDNVKIQNNVSIYEGVEIENDVFIGPSVVFTNVLVPRSEFPVSRKYNKTKVKRGSSIGANSTIICGNEIGEYSFIGAGSVVSSNVMNNSLVFGNPAKFKYLIGESGEKLKMEDSFGCDLVLNHKYRVIEKDNKIISVQKEL